MVIPVAIPRRPLSWEESWEGWGRSTSHHQAPELSGQVTGLSAHDLRILELNAQDHDAHTPSSFQALMEQQLARITKILIYRDIVNLYVGDPDGDKLQEIWEDLHSEKVEAYDVKTRLQRATEGKESGNRKYKNNNWFGAMYTYALSWGCMLPYFPEGLAPDDPLRGQYEKLECALFGNLAAVSITGGDDNEVDTETRRAVLHLGLRCVAVTVAMGDLITVGTMIKSCRRASDLFLKLEKLDPYDDVFTEKEKGWFKRQEAALHGIDTNKLFKDVETKRKVRRKPSQA